MLVGRDRECGVIDRLVAGARIGRSGVLVVTGEAGIGKTALLDYAAGAAGGTRLLRATGAEAERDIPFGGLAQLLHPTPAELDRLPPPQAEALGVALALRPGRDADRLAVGAATLSLLTRYAEDGPLGLLIDDGHLLDRPSAEALTFAARRLLADAVFVLVGVRSDEPTPFTAAGLPELALAGLDVAATRELLAEAGVSAEALHRATGGNPLALRTVAADPPSTVAPVPVPAAITAWFGRRTAALPPATLTVLLLVAGAGGDLAVVARAATALGADIRALAAAEEAGLVDVRADRVEFTHPLVGAAVYAGARPADRRAAHAALADATPAPDLDRRAWHRAEAALGPDDDCAAGLDAVADRAARRGAHAVSATARERAATLSSTDADRAGRLLAAGAAAWSAGDGDWARALLARCWQLDRSPPVRAGVMGLQGDIAARCGSLVEAHRLLVGAAEGVEPSRALILLAEAVNACYYIGDARVALATADRIERLLPSTTDPTATALGTMAVGMALVLAGRPGTDQIRAAVEAMSGLADGLRPTWLLLGPLWLRESDTGRRLVRAAVDERRARAALGTLPALLFHIARDGATTEHWTSAAVDYHEAIGLARELGHTTEVAIGLAGLSWLEARLGRDTDCRAHAAEALRLCAAQQIQIGRVWAEFALGELALGEGDLDTAVRIFTGLVDRLDEMGFRDPDVSPAPELAEALLRTGRTTDAEAIAAPFLAGATAKGQPWALARAARTTGLLAGDADLDEHFGRALDLHERTLDTFEEARTRLAYGGRLRRARRRVAARPELRAALDAFDRLGARRWATAAARELAATGETVHRRGDDDRDRLTARELQIALVLSEGRTTREAAAALFLSPKTVEYHLRHVYTKLGVTNRAELAARMVRDST